MAVQFVSRGLLHGVVILLLATSAAAGTATPSRAADSGDVVGGIVDILIKGARANQRKKAYDAWKRLEGPVIGCLRQRYRIEPNNLIQQGIGPDDKRVRPYVAACQEAQRQAESRAAEAQRQRERAAYEEAERQRRAQEDAAAEAKRQAEAEAARVAADRQARIKDLKARFPHAWVPKIMAGEIELGFSREAVLEALGRPREVVRTPDGSEMWTYSSMRVIFTSGKVTYFGE